MTSPSRKAAARAAKSIRGHQASGGCLILTAMWLAIIVGWMAT